MTYTIKKGDTLTSIANTYGTTVDALAGENGIQNKNLIYAGDTLNIPDGSTASGSSAIYSGGGGASSGAMGEVQKAADAVAKWQSEKPAAYDSAYSEKLDGLLSLLSGRSFSYDAQSDPLYRQYRDSITREGRVAMLDALGKGAGRTGGFSNSYAEGAAAGAYNEQLQKLGDIIPELYKAAYSRYSDEGDSIMKEISLLRDMDDGDWKRYNDMTESYLKRGNMLMDNYAELSDDEYDRLLDYAALLKKYAGA